MFVCFSCFLEQGNCSLTAGLLLELRAHMERYMFSKPSRAVSQVKMAQDVLGAEGLPAGVHF